MRGITRTRWQAASPLLDELLDADATTRSARLAQIRQDDAALASTLESLLAQQVAVETAEFLEGSAIGTPPLATLAGQAIGAYTLQRPLGEGGMGSVWLASRSDGRFEGQVAVKFLNLALLARGGAERFAREGSMLARLSHPNIGRLLDAGVATGTAAGGQPYLVLEYIDGTPIDAYCDAHTLGVEARLRLFLDVLAAVAHAHNNLILHRDLKPSNILVTRDGQVKLLDFGIGKLLAEHDAAANPELTQLAGRAFTPDYASPEQLKGEDVTTATDVYALGVLLYQLLVGKHPTSLPSHTPVDRQRAVIEDEPPLLSEAAARATVEVASRRGCSPRELSNALRGDLDNIVARALKKAPSERYATVAAFDQDLGNHLSGRPVSALADNRWYRARKFIARNRAVVGAASAVAMMLVAGASVALWQASVARAEADRAREINRFVLSLFRSANPFDGAGSEVRAVDLLKRAREKIEVDLIGRTDLQVELLTTVGTSLYGLAAHQEARETLERALQLAGPGAISALPGAGQAPQQLIDVLVVLGDYAAATALLDRVESGLRARRPGLDLVVALGRKSFLLLNMGRHEEAVSAAQEGTLLVRTLQNVPAAKTAQAIAQLARAQYHADKNEAALESAQAALALFADPDNHTRTEATRMRALIARILRDLNRFDEAAAALGAELPALRSAFGERSHEYAVNLSEYASLQATRGEFDLAAASIQQALQIATTIKVSDLNLSYFQRSAGLIALQKRDFDVAREHLARSVEYAERLHGREADLLFSELLLWQARILNGEQPSPPSRLRAVIEDRANRAEISFFATVFVGAHCTLGWQDLLGARPRSAIGHFELAAREMEGVRSHFIRLWCSSGLGRALLADNELDRAEQVLSASLQAHQKNHVRMTPSRAETLIAVAELHLRRGRVEQALLASAEADQFWQAYRPNSRYAGEAMLWHGRASLMAGQEAVGRLALQRGRTTLSKSPFPVDRQLVRSSLDSWNDRASQRTRSAAAGPHVANQQP